MSELEDAAKSFEPVKECIDVLYLTFIFSYNIIECVKYLKVCEKCKLWNWFTRILHYFIFR